MKLNSWYQMSAWLVLLVSILAPSCGAYKVVNESKVFRFSPSSGNDTLCLQDHSDTPCQSLKMAALILSTYRNNIRLEIAENCSLDDEVLQVYSGSYFIVITGVLGSNGNFPMIECIGCAGLRVTGSHNLTITNLSFQKCNVQSDMVTPNVPGNPVFSYSSAIAIVKSHDILIVNVSISCSPNSALYFINCKGAIVLSFVVMEINGHNFLGLNEGVHCGGLCIKQTGTDESTDDAHYNISHSVFTSNGAPYDNLKQTSLNYDTGYRGAMFAYFTNTTNNSLNIEVCKFEGNIGKRGGGMYIEFDRRATNNEVHIGRSDFSNNTAKYSGGALAIDYSANFFENTVDITFCNFTGNCAEFGGGLVILSEHSSRSPSGNRFVASKSVWSKNHGTLSSAIDISPKDPDKGRSDFLPQITFSDCNISSNTLGNFCKPHSRQDSINQSSRSHKAYHTNSGAVIITRFKVSFGGNMSFYRNKYVALVLVSATATFEKGSHTVFDGNEGYNGGAIGLYGFSQITLSRNQVLKFVNNHALNHGGAIAYRTIDQHSLTSGKNCFLRHQDLGNQSLVQTTDVIFENNSAEAAGESIYSESFTDCYYQCQKFDDNREGVYYDYSDITNCLGNFSIPASEHQIVSGGRCFIFENKSYNFSVIPGDQVDVPFTVVDDFNQTVNPLMTVNRVKTFAHTNVNVDHIYTLNHTITPIGEPRQSSDFTFTVPGVRQIYFYFTITLLPCPPGFYIDRESAHMVCKCGNGVHGYAGIIDCRKFHAKLKSGLWVGYVPSHPKNFMHLYFAPCAGPICSPDSLHLFNNDGKDWNLLPKDADKLSSFICAVDRTGILCGSCVDGTSTYYHSQDFKCKHNRLCHLGYLFYLLAEVLPLVVFFIVVITFDISFTSGRAVGFIFFAQQLDKHTGHINKYFTYLRIPYRVFYGLFNLEFFELESLSFCPWYHSQILHVIALKFVTIGLALGLVLLLISLFHYKCCSRICRLRKKVGARTSVVHGICAFLVICCTQSSKNAFYILQYSVPSGFNGATTSTYYSYYGGLQYFRTDHLVYAIPAIISVVFLTVLPPLVLLFYPLSLQLLSVCRLSEHKVVLKLLQLLHIHKLIFFIDCFQSCYKDRHRYFAGLYFVYRITILICYTINPHSIKFHVYSQIFLVIFLGIHCIIQPYTKRLHNVLDSLVFFNLSLINALVLVSELFVEESTEQSSNIHLLLLLVSSLQLVLIYMPMAVLIGWLGLKAYRHVRNTWLKNKRTSEIPVNDVVDYDRSQIEQCKSHSIRSYGSIRP